MYFKIKRIGEQKYIDMGMINVDASFYLEEGDKGYEKYIAEHYVQVPIVSGKYPGKTDEDGMPFDQKDFNIWLSAFPKKWKLNPFCNHSIQFEANVTEEEIIYCFELALSMTHVNYLSDDLQNIERAVNQFYDYDARKLFYSGIKGIPESKKTPTMKLADQLKVDAAIKVVALKDVFQTVRSIGKDKVG